jgi:inner membrane protein
VYVAAAICAAMPDLDVISWPFHTPNSSLWSHRAFTHSLLFAVIAGAAAVWIGFRGAQWDGRRVRLWVVLALATATHGLLDACTSYSFGVELLAPFTKHRYRFPIPPFGTPVHRLVPAIAQEFCFVMLPLSALLLLAWWRRRRAARAAAAISE